MSHLQQIIFDPRKPETTHVASSREQTIPMQLLWDEVRTENQSQKTHGMSCRWKWTPLPAL